MNEWLSALLLSFVQGFTEFLPISSSAHMIIVDKFLNTSINNQSFMIVANTGSLLAILLYFHKDILSITKNFISSPLDSSNRQTKLGWYLILATLPVIIIGGLFHEKLEQHFYNTFSIAINTIIFGLILGLALLKSKSNTATLTELTWQLALVIGIFQALALFPGVSRSGITLTAGLLAGLVMKDSARFAFLLSIPVDFAAIALPLSKNGSELFTLLNLFSLLATFIFSYLTLKFFFLLIKKANLWIFVIYRLLLGSLLLLI